MKRFSVALLSVLLIGLGSSAMSPWPSPNVPLTVTVDTTVDSNAPAYQACTTAPNDCSLRGAISVANSNVTTHDTIQVPAGTYTLTLIGTDDNNDFGDLDIWGPVTIVGTDPNRNNTMIEAGTAFDTGIDRVFHIFNTTEIVALSVLTIQFGKISSGAGGAGIYQDSQLSSVLLTQVTVVANEVTNSSAGAGVLVKGDMTMDDTFIVENYTNGIGGGIYTAANSHLTLNRSAVFENQANAGGGVYLSDDALIRNVTFFHNEAVSGGGGIYQLNDDSVLTMYHTTMLSDRLESGPTAGWALSFDGSVYIYNSILSVDAAEYPCENAGHIEGANNISTNTGCGSSFIVTDPLTALIDDNGGYTLTARLYFNSPAIDAGDVSHCLGEDQRGVARPLDGNGDGLSICDIGAFENPPAVAFLPFLRK